MTVTKRYCDHCGKEYGHYDIRYTSNIAERIAHSISADLCENCLNELAEIVSTFVNKENERKEKI